jgi:magnesium transporter
LNIVEKTYAAEAASAGASIHVAYYRDIYDHVVTMVQKLEVHSEVIGSLESTYLAKVSISVAQSANDVNEIMKKFSSVGTIILPLTYITGLFGMNVPIPWQVSVGDFYDTTPFYTLLSAMMIFALACVIWFRKNNWL